MPSCQGGRPGAIPGSRTNLLIGVPQVQGKPPLSQARIAFSGTSIRRPETEVRGSRPSRTILLTVSGLSRHRMAISEVSMNCTSDFEALLSGCCVEDEA